MRFQPVKCNKIQITKKQIKKITASYTLQGTVLDNVEKIKYFGITITNALKWNTHVSNICTKANRTLGFLRCNLAACPQRVSKRVFAKKNKKKKKKKTKKQKNTQKKERTNIKNKIKKLIT